MVGRIGNRVVRHGIERGSVRVGQDGVILEVVVGGEGFEMGIEMGV